MSAWEKVALANVGGLLGIGISLFVVPPNTPLWIWTTVAVVCLAVFNYLIIRRLQESTGASKVGSAPSIVIWLGVVVLLLELVFRYGRR
jgi:hypothetical protein